MQSYDAFVGEVMRLDAKIDHQLLKAERLRDICDRATTIWITDMKIQSSSGKTREERLAELIDCKQELESLVERRNRAEREITDYFNSVLNVENADVLILKYVYGKSISEIAEKRFYTYSGAANKISRADAKARAAYKTRSLKKADS